LINEYTREMDLEKENTSLKLQMESLRKEMEDKFQKIFSKIDVATLKQT
jgi:chromosome segregation ATPase